jgi:serine/threonine-protein kinase
MADAVLLAERVCDLDPMCLVGSTSAATVRYLGGAYEAAITKCRHTLDMDGHFIEARRLIAAALVQLGRCDEAIAEIEALRADRLDPVTLAWFGHALASSGNTIRAREVLGALRAQERERFVPAYHVALVHAGLGDRDAAFQLLDQACEQRDPWLDTLAVEPRFHALRGEPRYVSILDRLQLVELAGR